MPQTANTNPDMVRGTLALCDAIHHLARIRDARSGTKTWDAMQTVLHHLTQAAADLPDELWAMLMVSRHIGLDEVAARLQVVVREAAA